MHVVHVEVTKVTGEKKNRKKVERFYEMSLFCKNS